MHTVVMPKILVVDDRQENLFAMQDLLKDEGVSVLTASSGNEALSLMLRHRFALIIMDVMMPDMDGFETVELMNTNEMIRDTPVIFLTAMSKEEQHIFKGYAAGAVDYLFKPFNPDILKSKVRVFVRLQQAIAEQQQLERELQKNKSLAALGTLAGGIAHDYNNLLAAIMGNIEMAADDPSLHNDSRLYLQSAFLATTKARDLTRQLVTFSQGGFPLKRSMPIAGIIQTAVDKVLRDANSTCTYTLAPNLPPVDIDAEQMSQVFHNLATNAVEAMPQGGQLSIVADNVNDQHDLPPGLATGPYVRIFFADQGVGISADIMERIFDPYFSTKIRGTKKGMGLGLSVCQSIIQKHSGQISAQSAPGVGTTITIFLPAKRQKD